ncbi:hypothetical protein E4H12_09410 [Candidatus Thorarchaeota archaeon]|nr:MAG: hypothetical protein E4H12_09410 [Candidatus Thorarchaeota archaeon]
MENDSPQPYYDPYQQRSACNKTMIYCIVSIALLIASGAVTHPEVIANLPGGASTSSILSFVIIVAVILLCVWQAPRPKK